MQKWSFTTERNDNDVAYVIRNKRQTTNQSSIATKLTTSFSTNQCVKWNFGEALNNWTDTYIKTPYISLYLIHSQATRHTHKNNSCYNKLILNFFLFLHTFTLISHRSWQSFEWDKVIKATFCKYLGCDPLHKKKGCQPVGKKSTFKTCTIYQAADIFCALVLVQDQHITTRFLYIKFLRRPNL